MLKKTEHRKAYLAVLVLALVFWGIIIRMSGGNDVRSVYSEQLGNPTFASSLDHFIEFFLALPFGLVWCFPLLPLMIFADHRSRKSAAFKLTGIVALGAFLSLFPFWHGGGAVAGPRYITPFIILLFPEITDGIARLLQSYRFAAVTVPIITILFTPSLDFHNSLIYRWTTTPTTVNDAWAYADPMLQPGILAWRVVSAKAFGREYFHPSDHMPVVVRTRDIIPMTGVSRALYVLTENGAPYARVRGWLVGHGLAIPELWIFLRDLLWLTPFLWMSVAAGRVNRCTSKEGGFAEGLKRETV
jgi:hypothetical protein